LLGKKSILEKEVLTVSGIPLSLNDIQHTILKHNYDNDPVIFYGLYQGIVGGPNIRKNAYTGENVYRNLAKNAVDFANSNRGTASQSEKVFRVSSLYDRNRAYFPDFKPDLTAHLLIYLGGDERREIQAAKSLKPDINDWTITDLYGTFQRIGGSLADNNAALLDSVRSYTQGGGVPTSNVGMSTMLVTKTTKFDRVSPELLDLLTEMQLKTEMANTDKATVTVEEMGEVQEDTDPATDPDVREE
jgi:hypothetical protein